MKNIKEQIEFDIFLEGELINLVCLTEELIENTNWYNWFNDSESMRSMQKHYFPNTKKQQLQYFQNNIEGNINKLQLGIVHKKDNFLIGIISLNDIDYINKNAEIAGFIGEIKYHNFKYFIEANKIIIQHGFENLNLNKIYGGTLVKEIAIFYYRTLGFKNEGTRTNFAYKNGKYHDTYLIGLLKDEYHQLTKTKNTSS
jgi:RimJ/RimL family protein N-acetyltransferase